MIIGRIVLPATIAGLVMGGIACYLLGGRMTSCTVQTYVEVLPPSLANPLAVQPAGPQRDSEYARRLTIAHRIQSSRTFKELIGRQAVRRTKWFSSFSEVADDAALRAGEDLKRRLWASAQREGTLVEIRMTCRDCEEAALIVNEVVDLMLEQEDETGRDITAKMRVLNDQKKRLQDQLSAIENDNPDLSPAQAEQRERIKKERTAMIDAIDRQIEKSRQIREQFPGIKLKRAASAPLPAHVQYPLWSFSLVPAGAILGFVFGTMLLFLLPRAACRHEHSD